jgi:MFS family permease
MVMASRVGLPRLIAVSLIVFAGASVAFGFSLSLTELDIARAAQGLAAGAMWAGALAWMIEESPPEARGKLLGSVFAVVIAGTLLGPLIGLAAITAGTQLTFSLVAACAVFVGTFTIRTPGPVRRAIAVDSAPATLSVIGRSPRLRWSLWVMVLTAGAFGSCSTLLPLRLATLGASGPIVGSVFLLAAAVSMLASALAGRHSDRRGPASLVRGALFLFAAIAAVIALPNSLPLTSVLLVACTGLALTACFVPASTLVTLAAEEQRLSPYLASGLLTMTFAVGEALFVPATAILAQATSDVVPFLVLAGLAVLTASPSARRFGQPGAPALRDAQ